MALAPIPNPSVAPLIRRLAPQFKIDPRAAIAVALGEGGLQNRAKDIGDLSGGGSYGPFQLYTKGALPAQYRGRPQAADQWAWSPEGIKYALGRMAASGAAGLQGSAAVEAIIRKFERPLHPDKSVSNALARLSSIGGGSAIPGSSLPAALAGPSKPLTPANPYSTPQSGIRNILLQGLASGQEVYDLLPQLIAARGQSPIPAPQALKTPSVTLQSTLGRTPTTPAKPAPATAGLVRPLATPIGKSSEFGMVDAEGAPGPDGKRYHSAKDWFAPAGATVAAPWNGTIVEVKPSRGNSGQIFGGVVKVRDANGRVFVARHIDPLKFKVGQQVAANTPIGRVSAWTGGSPHAHVEVWKTLEGGYNHANMIDPTSIWG